MQASFLYCIDWVADSAYTEIICDWRVAVSGWMGEERGKGGIGIEWMFRG